MLITRPYPSHYKTALAPFSHTQASHVYYSSYANATRRAAARCASHYFFRFSPLYFIAFSFPEAGRGESSVVRSARARGVAKVGGWVTGGMVPTRGSSRRSIGAGLAKYAPRDLYSQTSSSRDRWRAVEALLMHRGNVGILSAVAVDSTSNFTCHGSSKSSRRLRPLPYSIWTLFVALIPTADIIHIRTFLWR